MGLYQALYLILEEGEATVYRRHLDAHHLLVMGLEKIGMTMLVDEAYRLPMLNSVSYSRRC